MTSLCLHSLIGNNLTSCTSCTRYNRGPHFALFQKDSGLCLLDISLHTLPIPSALFMIANVAIWTVFNRENTMPCLTHDASSTTLFTYFRITGADRKLPTVSPLLQFSRRELSSLVMDRRNEYRAVTTIIKWQICGASFFTCNCVF